MHEIEAEVTKRRVLVDKLQQDAVTAEKLTAVNKEQVEAISQVLRAQIESERRSSLWVDQGFAVLWMILGAVLSEVARWVVRWLNSRR